ncbi:hypothetical protein BC833DRAFT_653004 [Globomyces pollinis-pini]|nr:hypothetical protein BC833DRAFT_653004 [Globomyces pollinis-pini]
MIPVLLIYIIGLLVVVILVFVCLYGCGGTKPKKSLDIEKNVTMMSTEKQFPNRTSSLNRIITPKANTRTESTERLRDTDNLPTNSIPDEPNSQLMNYLNTLERNQL